jgi:hypothetical protein
MFDVSAYGSKNLKDLVQLPQLQREADSNRLIYELFLGLPKEAGVQQGIQQADSRILSHAVFHELSLGAEFWSVIRPRQTKRTFFHPNASANFLRIYVKSMAI